MKGSEVIRSTGLKERSGEQMQLSKNRVAFVPGEPYNVQRITKETQMHNNTYTYHQASEDYKRIEQAILFLEKNKNLQPELKDIAGEIGISEYHFQRLFTRWAGISPKRFLQYLTKQSAKEWLEKSENLLETAYQVGLSSLGRLHDLFITTEAITPGEYKSRGAGLTIRYGIHETPFGKALVGITDRGICHLGFVESGEGAAIDTLVLEWKQARLMEDHQATAIFVEPIFDLKRRSGSNLKLHLRGSNFQLKVWEALMNIQPGRLTTYERLAQGIGDPSASRAVGNAVGHNPVAVLIPCHRVIRKVGEFGNYRYGSARKKALLGWEASQLNTSERILV